MNINNSGKIPDMIKRIAAVAAVLSITLCAGCVSTETSDVPSEQTSCSEDNSTHIPIEDSSEGGESSNSSENSGYSAGVSSKDSSVGDSSSDASSGTESSIGVTNPSEPSGTAEPSVSEMPPESSSVTSEPNSGSDPPLIVVVPDFPVPTSPGTSCAVSEYGAIDYSNSSQGYISAKYTGDKSRAKLVIKCGDKAYNHDLALDQTEYFSLPFGSGEYTVMIGEITPNGKYAIVLEQSFTVNIDHPLSPFLYPNKYSNYNKNSNCVYKAAEVCAGKSGSVEKIAAIFEWVTSNITYDHELSETVQSGYVPDPDRTFNSRKGICFDYASLMCAMLRSQSIPARLVIGYASPDIYHAWNEIYTEETGWITPELMLKKAGYNIADSTFYASAGDKSQIASYISNEANYQALYYY